MTAIWKDIPGYEGLYQVSISGQIKSLSRKLPGRFNSVRILKEKILIEQTKKGGYKQVFLQTNPTDRKAFRIHQLVMLAFEGVMPDDCELIMHLDDDPSNNAYVNLKYGTQSQNVIDSIRKNRFKIPNGKPAKPIIAIDINTGKEVRFESMADARRELKVSAGSISDICNNAFKRVRNYTFKIA